MTAIRFTNNTELTPDRQTEERAEPGFKRAFDDLVTRPLAKVRASARSLPRAVDQRFDAEPSVPRTRSSELAVQAQAVAQPRARDAAPTIAKPRTRSKDTLKTPVSRTQGLPTLRAPAHKSAPAPDAPTSDAALPAATSSDVASASTTTDSTATATATANPRVSQVISGVVDALIGLTGMPDAIDLPDPGADPQGLADRVFAGAIGVAEPSLPAIVIDEPHDTQEIEIRDTARPAPAATPLEQAIQELLMAAHAEGAAPAEAPAPVAPVMPATQPDMPAPSHMHLVMDDGAVLTVAVRGNDVHVAMRGDDRTAAGLARNAAVLDDALRDRGLTLAELSAEPDPRRQRDAPQRERPDHETETFTLEDKP